MKWSNTSKASLLRERLVSSKDLEVRQNYKMDSSEDRV